MGKRFLLILLIIISVLFVFGCRPKTKIETSETPESEETEAVVGDKGTLEEEFVDEIPEEVENEEETSPMELLHSGLVNEFEFQIGDSINDVIESWGHPVVEPFYWAGGEWYNYGDFTFIMWIDDPIIRHIGFENDVTIYGIRIGDSVEKIMETMGPDPEVYAVNSSDIDFDDELAIHGEDKQVLYYESGDYFISFYCDDSKLIHGYIMYKGD